MLRKFVKLVCHPGKYIPLAIEGIQPALCYLFRRSAFFMQGQMDINTTSRWHNPKLNELTGGYFPKNNTVKRQICDLEPWDITRRDMLVLLLRTIIEKNIEGDFVELGVYKGTTAKLMHYYAPERKLHLFDTFEGFTERSVIQEQKNTWSSVSASNFSDTTLEKVRHYISAQNQNVSFYKGYFPETIPDNFDALKFAFVHLDVDLYEPTFKGMEYFYPRMSRGGIMLVHDYNAWLGARMAVDAFFADKNEIPVPMPDKSGSALIVKQR
jgi:O-methyltransferase